LSYWAVVISKFITTLYSVSGFINSVKAIIPASVKKSKTKIKRTV
jgi:hypothetical protein